MIPPSLRPLKPRNKIEMVGSDSRTRNKYLRRCKRSFIDCIPNELLFEIMLRLPAQDIYFGARLVCWNWYRMTHSRNFILKHLERASSGLLCRDEFGDIVSISAREDGGFDIYKLNYKKTDSNRLNDLVWSSWNGLVLGCDCSHKIYHVKNILTGQVFRLPQIPYAGGFLSHSGIGYDAASMTYKVVVSYRDTDQYQCVILTLGVDKSWRIVRTDHLSDSTKHALLSDPINTEGFVNWRFANRTFLTLNLETEVIAETSPSPLLKYTTRPCVLPARRHVSHFVQLRGRFVWEIFEMKPEIGKWKKLPNICLEGQKRKIERLVGFNLNYDSFVVNPWGWLKYPEILALRIAPAHIIFYNLITCEFGAKMFSIFSNYGRVTHYMNSLVWLDGI